MQGTSPSVACDFLCQRRWRRWGTSSDVANGQVLSCSSAVEAGQSRGPILTCFVGFLAGTCPLVVLDRSAKTPLWAGLAHPPSGGRLTGSPPGGPAIGVPTARGGQSTAGEGALSVARETARHAVHCRAWRSLSMEIAQPVCTLRARLPTWMDIRPYSCHVRETWRVGPNMAPMPSFINVNRVSWSKNNPFRRIDLM